jgi:hypothetical protein
MTDMTPAQREMFRLAILRVLETNGTSRYGLTAENISHFLPQFGFRATVAQVDHELNYLSGEPLCHVDLVNKGGFSPEVRPWKITTRGMNFLAEQSA